MVILQYCSVRPWLHSHVGGLLHAVGLSFCGDKAAVAAAGVGVMGEVVDGLCPRVREIVSAVVPWRHCNPR